MTRRELFFVCLISLIVIAALLSGCETISYLRERNRPIKVPSTDSERFTVQVVWTEAI